MKKFLKIFAFSIVYVMIFMIISFAALLWRILNSSGKTMLEQEFLGNSTYYVIYTIILIIFLLFPFVYMIWKRPRMKALIGRAALTMLAYVLILCLTTASAYLYFSRFTPSKWTEHPYQRHLMGDDLKKKYELVGMTVDEVKELLGEPDKQGQSAVIGDRESLQYIAGTSMADYWIFDVQYDKNNIVTGVTMYMT